jgi:hypothetical protein
VPTVGVIEAGFALSFNYFETDPQFGMWLPFVAAPPRAPAARTVEDGIRIFTPARASAASRPSW